MRMDKIVLNKLLSSEPTAEQPKRVLYAKSKWTDDQINVFLQDAETSKCYNGCLTRATAMEVSNELGLTCEEYLKACYELLTTGVPLDGYTYELNCVLKKLTIRKLPLNCIFLDLDLYEIENNCEFMEDAITVFQQQTLMLQEQNEEIQQIYKQFEMVKSDFCRIAEEKQQLESTLMKKFLIILNNKKMKIAELETRLRKYEGVNTHGEKQDSDDDPNILLNEDNSITNGIKTTTQPNEFIETIPLAEASDEGIPVSFQSLQSTD